MSHEDIQRQQSLPRPLAVINISETPEVLTGLSTIKYPQVHFCPPTQSPPKVDAEKQRLFDLIQQLERNKREQEARIQEL
eukprot:CAMPEP_0206207082 /NCGR_PEP_ID=MMETSP0166-20121206/15373_1 /ASSEMBLY_ACC=CAM_ASM_000260 /TAXON_ID=95228 /ORGANISM="Vannella robusta, Strain DIVA3 518/3/11/1/6" /LENGTH=79 /DNA_ID=CAMNT_0053627763 /DNA_START=14 /DNA_END=249 /DNA_ORIENTATION=-